MEGGVISNKICFCDSRARLRMRNYSREANVVVTRLITACSPMFCLPHYFHLPAAVKYGRLLFYLLSVMLMICLTIKMCSGMIFFWPASILPFPFLNNTVNWGDFVQNGHFLFYSFRPTTDETQISA